MTALGETRYPESLSPEMIAPCGMDCGVCIAHLRQRRPCPGCTSMDDSRKPNHCVGCSIKHCVAMGDGDPTFCSGCATFPCVLVRRLDKRYRTKYGMSMIENLEAIRDTGLERFVEMEKDRWTCPGCGAVICVHRPACVYCGEPRNAG